MEKVVITGGSGDIAQAIARRLEKAGGYEIKTPGHKELDVTDMDSVNAYFDAYVPDILVNNAGYCVPTSVFDGNIENEHKGIDINLTGTFNCTMAVLNRNHDARIVNVASSAATKVHGTWASYCAAKAGVVMATRCWAEAGAHVVAISPGRTQTKMRTALVPVEDPDTLLKTDEFAEVIYKAITGCYENGAHINVNVGNVQELINE